MTLQPELGSLLSIFDQNLENPLYFILMYLPFLFFLFYGQRFQTWMVLSEVSRALNKLKGMKERARKDTIEYLKSSCKPEVDPTERLDQILEYFTIMPVDLDPSGVVRKIEHLVTVRDDRIRAEVKKLAGECDEVRTSTVENIVEVATALNFIYKVVRHYYLLGKRTTSLYVLIQLQMIMPLILQEAEALTSAVVTMKQAQPLGDGIGAVVAGKLMLNAEKKVIAKDTVMTQVEHLERSLYLVKAEGPMGYVGEPGNALDKMIGEMGVKPKAIIMIDAALKLEGERTGEVAEGVGAAIGGIGVDRYKIEEVATKYNIPLYAIVIKESILDAITVMKKEIVDSVDKVIQMVNRLIEEKTSKGDTVFIVGVGNTLGVGQ